MITSLPSADPAWDLDSAAFRTAERCMAVVNRDRNCAAEEAVGFTTAVWCMDPPHCTPRNQIMAGWPSLRQGFPTG